MDLQYQQSSLLFNLINEKKKKKAYHILIS
jgi:hypothetical protein